MAGTGVAGTGPDHSGQAHPDPHGLLALAVAVALEAGAMLADRDDGTDGAGRSGGTGLVGRPVVVGTKSSPTDVVTDMDQAAEHLIRSRILAARPDDAILGEEGGQTGGQAPVRWIVDPLDGTVNYLYGLPDWAVSIAAEVGGQVVAGVVCVPRRDALFGSVAGTGSWRSSIAGIAGTANVLYEAYRGGDGPIGLPPARAQRLACTAGVPLARALIATGFGYERGRRLVQGQVLSAVLPRVRDIRRNGACAVDLCALAAGNVDGYYERGVHYWDIAAGTLIAREAGALVAGLAGRPASPSMIVGAGPGLFGELRDLLLGLDAERDA